MPAWLLWVLATLGTAGASTAASKLISKSHEDDAEAAEAELKSKQGSEISTFLRSLEKESKGKQLAGGFSPDLLAELMGVMGTAKPKMDYEAVTKAAMESSVNPDSTFTGYRQAMGGPSPGDALSVAIGSTSQEIKELTMPEEPVTMQLYGFKNKPRRSTMSAYA